jgi:integrase
MSIGRRETMRGTVYDVRLRDPSGRAYKRTFRTRKEATDYEAREISLRSRGEWIDPRAGRVSLEVFSTQWMADRAALRPRTREFYEWVLRKHVLPYLGTAQIGSLRPSDVRAWHASLLSSGIGPPTVAKAYRLLCTILQTAVTDGTLGKNPCNIRGAGVEHSPERPVATIEEVEALADAVNERHRALVLLAAFCALRLSELLALRRDRIDLVAGVVHVVEGQHELADKRTIVGPPKTEAGRRHVAIPPHIVPALQEHLDRFVGPEPQALLFTGVKGGWQRRSHWNSEWRAARVRVGLPELRFHDYADILVMPTFLRSACSLGVNVPKLSA